MKNITKKKTVLVTGGAGFIGSHLCERLLKERTVGRVVCVDNLDPAYPVELKKENLALLTPNKNFYFYKVDICDRPALKKVFEKEKPDYVVNLAAKTDTRLSVVEPESYVQVNVAGALNILELSREFKVKGVSLFSSSSVYGDTKEKPPFKETVSTDFPLSPYGATKKAGELLGHTYSYNHHLPVICFRLFNVYGERMRPGPVISRWVENIFADKPVEVSSTKKIKRDFTYVGDVVSAIVKSFDKNKSFNIVNVAASNPASLFELLSVIEKVSGKKAIVVKRESNRASIETSHAHIHKAKKLLGWKPEFTLEKGVGSYVNWYKKNKLS